MKPDSIMPSDKLKGSHGNASVCVKALEFSFQSDNLDDIQLFSVWVSVKLQPLPPFPSRTVGGDPIRHCRVVAEGSVAQATDFSDRRCVYPLLFFL